MKHFTFLLLSSLALASPTALADEVAPDFVELGPIPSGAMGTSVWADGDRFIAGGPGTFGGRGSAFVNERIPGSDDQKGVKHLQPDNSGPVEFGASVILRDGRAVVGAPADNGGRGAVYVFEESAGWAQVAKLVDPNGAVGDRLGDAISLDGDRLLAGAPNALNDAGAGQNIDRQPDGTWALAFSIDSGFTGISAHAGTSVALTGDHALLGAPGVPWTHFATAGIVNHYRRQPNGTWQLADQLRSVDDDQHHDFGLRMAVSGDRLAVYGEYGHVITDAEVRLYDLSPQGQWIEESRAVGSTLHQHHPSLSLHGNDLVVGDGNSCTWLIQLPDGSWTQSLYYTHPLGQGLPFRSVSISDEMFVAGVADGFGEVRGTYRRLLYRSAAEISLSDPSGGVQLMHLRLDPSLAGTVEVMLGSLSGTSPGVPVPNSSFVLPLAQDDYFDLLLADPSLISSGGGIVQPDGSGYSALLVPVGVDPMLVGTVAHHASVLFDFSGGQVQTIGVTNPIRLELVP